MSFFFKQAIRLLRTKWKSPQLLAEELYSMFQADVPDETDQPVIINSSTGEPPLTVRDFGDGDFLIEFGDKDGSLGGIVVDDDGQFQFADPPASAGQQPTPQTPAGSGGGGIPGKIISQSSGAVYNVELYEDGPSNPTTRTVTVAQLQIDLGEIIPANTWAIIASQTVAEAEVFSMQVPVWANDL